MHSYITACTEWPYITLQPCQAPGRCAQRIVMHLLLPSKMCNFEVKHTRENYNNFCVAFYALLLLFDGRTDCDAIILVRQECLPALKCVTQQLGRLLRADCTLSDGVISPYCQTQQQQQHESSRDFRRLNGAAVLHGIASR